MIAFLIVLLLCMIQAAKGVIQVGDDLMPTPHPMFGRGSVVHVILVGVTAISRWWGSTPRIKSGSMAQATVDPSTSVGPLMQNDQVARIVTEQGPESDILIDCGHITRNLMAPSQEDLDKVRSLQIMTLSYRIGCPTSIRIIITEYFRQAGSGEVRIAAELFWESQTSKPIMEFGSSGITQGPGGGSHVKDIAPSEMAGAVSMIPLASARIEGKFNVIVLHHLIHYMPQQEAEIRTIMANEAKRKGIMDHLIMLLTSYDGGSGNWIAQEIRDGVNPANRCITLLLIKDRFGGNPSWDHVESHQLPQGVQEIMELESSAINQHALAARIDEVRKMDHSISFNKPWVKAMITAQMNPPQVD